MKKFLNSLFIFSSLSGMQLSQQEYNEYLNQLSPELKTFLKEFQNLTLDEQKAVEFQNGFYNCQREKLPPTFLQCYQGDLVEWLNRQFMADENQYTHLVALINDYKTYRAFYRKNQYFKDELL